MAASHVQVGRSHDIQARMGIVPRNPLPESLWSSAGAWNLARAVRTHRPLPTECPCCGQSVAVPTSQSHLSSSTGPSPNTYGRWERGEVEREGHVSNLILDRGEFARVLAMFAIPIERWRLMLGSVERGADAAAVVRRWQTAASDLAEIRSHGMRWIQAENRSAYGTYRRVVDRWVWSEGDA